MKAFWSMMAAAGLMAGASALDFQPITVRSAEYGTNSKKVDLTPKMAASTRDGRVLIFQASNQFAGKDPAVKQGKVATVVYKNAKGEEQRATAREGQFLCVFDLGEAIPAAPTVLGAWYGNLDEFKNAADVTEAVRKAIAAKTGCKANNDLVNGKDPAVGKNKALIVLYAKGGKAEVKLVGENRTFTPAEIGF